jgi:hypothetical protein
MLRVLRLPPEATRSVKTHHEAHFIRLGIGRAVYAYGELPESLDTLVKAGLLPRRYLADENEKPLRSRREGGFLVVESIGPGAWTYRSLAGIGCSAVELGGGPARRGNAL